MVGNESDLSLLGSFEGLRDDYCIISQVKGKGDRYKGKCTAYLDCLCLRRLLGSFSISLTKTMHDGFKGQYCTAKKQDHARFRPAI